MSSTTTQTRTANTILRDYELHHSADPSGHGDTVIDQIDSPPWETSYRRVPPYRPIDRNRDQTHIRVYASGVERAFITTMFTGVYINATAAKTWRRSFERIKDGIFRYRIGGEY